MRFRESEEKMEFWDIYDSEKKKTGRTMKRNDWCLKDGEYHLTVLGVIMRPDHRFLITKRVMTKAWAPGWWEVSGGAAMAGETSEEAVRREIQEETGLDVSDGVHPDIFFWKFFLDPENQSQNVWLILELKRFAAQNGQPFIIGFGKFF